jgi:hypothetical protein
MKYVFRSPNKVMVGTRGEVGARLFLLQVREERRLVIIKCEKQQLAALSEWISAALDQSSRPGHLPDDLGLEPEYEPDFAAGEITASLADERIELILESIDGEDSAEVSLSLEWAGALAIACSRLVSAGRAPRPLCGGPLDPRGHDCPRTNGFAAPPT